MNPFPLGYNWQARSTDGKCRDTVLPFSSRIIDEGGLELQLKVLLVFFSFGSVFLKRGLIRASPLRLLCGKRGILDRTMGSHVLL